MQINKNKQPIVVVTCMHCKEPVKMRKPAKPGFYKITCPSCKKPFPVKIADKNPENAGAQGKAVVSCPKCLHPIAFAPKKSGIYRLTCPNDNHVFSIKVSLPTDGRKVEKEKDEKKEENSQLNPSAPKEQSAPTTPKAETNAEEQKPTPASFHEKPATVSEPVRVANNQSVSRTNSSNTDDATIVNISVDLARNTMGCLVHHRILRPKIVYHLKEGRNVIGRPDSSGQTDIEITGDETISRRSVVISVEKSKKGIGFFFKLIVQKATNKVLWNEKEMKEGDTQFLNYGDRLQLGKTRLIFEKEK